jgi:hypothetical protein
VNELHEAVGASRVVLEPARGNVAEAFDLAVADALDKLGLEVGLPFEARVLGQVAQVAAVLGLSPV